MVIGKCLFKLWQSSTGTGAKGPKILGNRFLAYLISFLQ